MHSCNSGWQGMFQSSVKKKTPTKQIQTKKSTETIMFYYIFEKNYAGTTNNM